MAGQFNQGNICTKKEGAVLAKFFLTTRKQRVMCFLIGPMLRQGLPQGAMFGLLLFLSYVNDLDSVIKNSAIRIFADDVLLYIPAQQGYFALQDDLTAISKSLATE